MVAVAVVVLVVVVVVVVVVTIGVQFERINLILIVLEWHGLKNSYSNERINDTVAE